LSNFDLISASEQKMLQQALELSMLEQQNLQTKIHEVEEMATFFPTEE